MKLKHIISSLIALCALTVGCATLDEGYDLINLQVDNSYVAIPQDGGSKTIKVNAYTDWAVYVEEIEGNWLNINKMSGAKGKTDLTFSAEAVEGYRNATVRLVPAKDTSHSQIIYVAQGTPLPPAAMTVKEILADAVEGKVYKATGIVTQVEAGENPYGNWYLKDDTGTIQIYGTLYNGQEKQTPLKKLGIEEGDEVTVEGAFVVKYSELKNVTVTDIKKCLMKVPQAEYNVTAEGGDIDVKVVFVAKDYTVDTELPEWITRSGIKMVNDTTVFTYTVAKSTVKERSHTIKMTATQGNQVSKAEIKVSQESGLTAEPLPYSCTFAENLGGFKENAKTLPSGKTSIWGWDSHNYAKATSGGKVDSESDLVSPAIDLTGVDAANLTFEHTQRFAGNVYEEMTLWASVDDGETWAKVNIPNYPDGSNWTFVSSGTISLKPFVGKKVKLAFKYKSNANYYATWEIKNVKVEAGIGTLTSVAEIASLGFNKDVTTDFTATLTDALVTYVNGNNAFIEDKTGGMLLYKSGHGLTAGKVINGQVSGKMTYYGGFPEATALDVSGATLTNGTVTPTTLTIPQLLAKFDRYVSCIVKIEGASLDKDVEGSSARNANLVQGTDQIGFYAKVKDLKKIAKGANGDFIVFPCYNNTTQQVGFWVNDHFTAK